MNKQAIQLNHEKMLERRKVYQQYGYDQDASRDFILSCCLPLKLPVLEIGTGKGHMAILLAKSAGKIITVDNSAAEQEFARLNAAAENVLAQIGFVTRDAADLPYPNQSFGTVVSVNAFHHFEKPFAVLDEMIRLCFGKIIIADFNKEGFNIVRKIHKDEGHEHEEQCGDFSIVGQYLEEHGFAVKQQEDYCQLVYVAGKKQ